MSECKRCEASFESTPDRAGALCVACHLAGESAIALWINYCDQKEELSLLREQNAEQQERLDKYDALLDTGTMEAWRELPEEDKAAWFVVTGHANHDQCQLIKSLADALLVHIDRKTCPDCERYIVDGEPHDDTCRYAPVVREARGMFADEEDE